MKVQDIKIDLGAVQETLILPLWARAREMEKKNPIVYDTYAPYKTKFYTNILKEYEMELIPELEIGWLNGWILVCLLYITYGVLLKIFPKDVVARLYDKSGRSKRNKVIILIGSLLAFVYFGLIIFTPLKVGSGVFVVGIIAFIIGLTGFVIALLNFKNAPPDQPITRGLYRISRHPQQLMFFITFIGICFAIGSWIALFIQLISSIFLHTRVLAEEKACLARYGDSYQRYMKRVPRYLIFF